MLARVSALAVYRHRRCYDKLFYLRPPLHDRFEQHRSAEVISSNIATNLIHRLAHTYLSRLMVNDVHSFEGTVDEIGVANITLQKLSFGIEVLWTSTAMDLFDQNVENSDPMTLIDERINQMRADETGAARDKNVLH
jgi:hypothetical protein